MPSQALGIEPLRCVNGEPGTCERVDACSILSVGKQDSEDRREPEAKRGTSGKAPSPLRGSEVGYTAEWSQMQRPGEASPGVLPSTVGRDLPHTHTPHWASSGSTGVLKATLRSQAGWAT